MYVVIVVQVVFLLYRRRSACSSVSLEIAVASLFQSLVIHRESLLDILMQSLRSPSTEPHGDGRLHTVSEGDNHIQIVVCDIIVLAVCSSCSVIPNN